MEAYATSESAAPVVVRVIAMDWTFEPEWLDECREQSPPYRTVKILVVPKTRTPSYWVALAPDVPRQAEFQFVPDAAGVFEGLEELPWGH